MKTVEDYADDVLYYINKGDAICFNELYKLGKLIYAQGGMQMMSDVYDKAESMARGKKAKARVYSWCNDGWDGVGSWRA